MALSVLITQCLQRDFVDLIEPYDPLPNRLHVGHAEAQRLLGADPKRGSVAQLMAAARAMPEEEIEIIHIRDWHDPTDARQQDHLAMFGAHCVRDTEGARLVLDLDHGVKGRPNERIVDTTVLNDFEGTSLAEHFAAIRERVGDEPIRVGVVGVWTEAKVSFLLYDLKTRLGIDALATCSALTASASRVQHFNALEQLSRILGVRCFDSVGEFLSWLTPGSSFRVPPAQAKFGPALSLEGEPTLTEADREIIGYLYRDSAKISLHPLAGGFSGAQVFRATSVDALGHRQAPSVVKLGPNGAIAKERVAFERVEEILGNNAPSVRGFVDLGQRAGIKYSYAAMGQGQVRSLKALFEAGAPQEKLDVILRSVFDEILGPLYAAARYEKLPILEHYGFSPAWAPSVRESVTRLVGDQASGDELIFAHDLRVGNVCHFYERFLAEPLGPQSDFHYVSLVHGDLNGANILVDARENVWVIDFFHTGPGHVLKDLAKLENDILYIFTAVESEEQLREGLALTRALRAVKDLKEPLPERIEGVHSPLFLRAWDSVRVLREMGGRLCREDRHPLPMNVALLRFAMHTLTFAESSHLQKTWALFTACGLADDIMAAKRADRALRVDWLESPVVSPSRVGLTICPGRRDRGRDLYVDLQVLKDVGTSRLLCLLTEEELAWAGVIDLPGAAARLGITFLRHAIPDQGVPSEEDAVSLVAWCCEAIERGERVVIHCMGGLGRTGMVAACFLAARGQGADDAIAAVRRARGPRAVETVEQEQFVATFAASLAR